MPDMHKLLGDLRQFVDSVAGENRPSREWAIDLRNRIDAISERAAYRTVAQGMIATLAAAGFRILGPDEIYQVTWQPIETAPKDGIVLIAHHPKNRWRGSVRLGYVHSNYNGHSDVITEDGRAGWPIRPRPTHWTPVPTPPATGRKA